MSNYNTKQFYLDVCIIIFFFFCILQVVALISITFIILSTVVLTLNTLPYFDKRDENNNERDYPPFALLEAIYMSWFTFEFLVSNVYLYVLVPTL